MSNIKNTGKEANQLSDLDFGQVLKDSHRESAHAIDVVQVNSFVPDKYSKVDLINDADGCPTEVTYYGYGVSECTRFIVRESPQGVAEKTLVGLTTIDAVCLDGKYFLIYDDAGSVGVWFDLDNTSTPPTTGASRDIEVDISASDSSTVLATKLSSTLNSDSEFIASPLSSIAVISSVSLGNKTDASDVDTELTFSVTDGVDSLNSKYSVLYSASDATKYYLWYNINAAGVDPALAGATGIEVTLTLVDNQSSIATKTAAALDALEDFIATSSNTEVTFTNYRVGSTTEFDIATNEFVYKVLVDGEDLVIVAKLLLTYDVDGFLTGVEKVQ